MISIPLSPVLCNFSVPEDTLLLSVFINYPERECIQMLRQSYLSAHKVNPDRYPKSETVLEQAPDLLEKRLRTLLESQKYKLYVATLTKFVELQYVDRVKFRGAESLTEDNRYGKDKLIVLLNQGRQNAVQYTTRLYPVISLSSLIAQKVRAVQ